MWVIDSPWIFPLCRQHKLSAVKAIASIIECLQVSIAECQQAGKHPTLVALGSLPLQVHFPLCRDDGLDIVGLFQSLYLHIIVHTQENVLQIGTGKAVFGYFPDTAVLHIGSENAFKHCPNLRFSLASIALNDHHALPLIAGNQAVANKFLECGYVLRVQQIIQKLKPARRLCDICAIRNREPTAYNLCLALCKSPIQEQRSICQVNPVCFRRKIIYLGFQLHDFQNVVDFSGNVIHRTAFQLFIDFSPKR